MSDVFSLFFTVFNILASQSMQRNLYIRALTKCSCLAAMILISCTTQPQKEQRPEEVQPVPVQNDITVAAYYFPNYHEDDRNAAFHGDGWTEWKLVDEAKPRFEEHNQPKVPEWGYTDEADPVQMAQKIKAAADHGIDAFIFDWYYYDDGLFLERGLEEGFMQAQNNDRMQFGLMWANHDWLDIHPMSKKVEPETLYPGSVTPETFDIMTDYIVEKYFKHDSYWLVDGEPYFSFYDLQKLVESFGSVEATKAALDQFREKTVQAGFKGLNLNAVVWGQPILPSEEMPRDLPQLVGDLGFNSATSYVWIHHVVLEQFPETPYDTVKTKYMDFMEDTWETYDIPYYANLTMGWDSSPRCKQDEEFENISYPFMPTISYNTPANFKQAAMELRDAIANQPENERILTINCWNEWTEGSYLEPDKVTGMQYLEGLKEVFVTSNK